MHKLTCTCTRSLARLALHNEFYACNWVRQARLHRTDAKSPLDLAPSAPQHQFNALLLLGPVLGSSGRPRPSRSCTEACGAAMDLAPDGFLVLLPLDTPN